MQIDPSGELISIAFDDRVATTADMLAELDMAYAMTVHKAQGSEYRAVIFVSAPAAPGLMVRGVLYTAITRARELLILVGDDVSLGKMAANDRRTRRYSGLRWRLQERRDGMSLKEKLLDLFSRRGARSAAGRVCMACARTARGRSPTRRCSCARARASGVRLSPAL